MKKEILVNVEFQEKKVAIVEDGHLEEFYVERHSDKQLVGSIFKGKVSSIVPGIGAAFIDLALEKNGFLYVTDVLPVGLDSEEAVDVENGDKPQQPHPHHGRKDRHEPTPQIQDVLKKDHACPYGHGV